MFARRRHSPAAGAPSGFDWRALAWIDAASLDGIAWPVPHEPPTWPFDGDIFHAQLLLGELLDLLRRRVVAGVDGWVGDPSGLGPTVRDGVRDLEGCRSVFVLVGAGRARRPQSLRRAAAWRAAGRRCAWRDVRIVRTTSAPVRATRNR